MFKDILRIVYELTEVQVTAQPGTGHRRERRKLKDLRRGQETLKMRWKCCLIRLPFSLPQTSRKTWQPPPGRFQKRGTRSRIAHCFTQAPLVIELPLFFQPLHGVSLLRVNWHNFKQPGRDSQWGVVWIRAVCRQAYEQCSYLGQTKWKDPWMWAASFPGPCTV